MNLFKQSDKFVFTGCEQRVLDISSLDGPQVWYGRCVRERVCVRERERGKVCVCVCEREREREREGRRGRGGKCVREGGRGRGRMTERSQKRGRYVVKRSYV